MVKLKEKSKRNVISGELFRKSFEFLAPMPLEECAERLQMESKRGTSWYSSRKALLVNVFTRDADTREFYMNRDAGRNLNVEAYGALTRWNEQHTRVSGYTQIGMLTRILLVLCIFPCVIFVLVARFSPFALLSVVTLGFLWILTFKARDGLVSLLYETLGD